MRISYLSLARVPSRRANSIHVMKMCQAFVEADQAIELVVPSAQSHQRSTVNKAALAQHYGLHTDFPIQWLRGTDRFRYYDFALRSAKYIWQTKPDLIYARYVAGAAVTATLGIPTILEIHSPVGSVLERLSFRRFCAAKGFRKLVVITQALRVHLASQPHGQCRPEETAVLPDAVDLDRFEGLQDSAREREKLQLEQRFTVGYSGHLYAGRGIEQILQLAALLPKFQFLLIGGTEEDIHKYAQLAQSMALTNLQLIGFVPNLTLPHYLGACDVLLMPHQAEVRSSGGGNITRWTSPMKMFEYMAAQRPIIASDLPVLREVLNEQNSILCSPADLDAWQHAIVRVAKDQELRTRLSHQAACDVQQFTWRNRVEHILRMYS